MTQARRNAGITGLVAIGLFVLGSAIWGLDMPEDGTPVAEVMDFYRDSADRIVVGASLSLLAVGGFVVFAAALRQVLLEAGADDFLAMAMFGGAVLGMVAGLGAESVNMVGGIRARDGDLTEGLAQSVFEISQVLGSVSVGVGLGIFALATGVAALRTEGIVPRWVAAVLCGLGVLVLTPLAHVNWLPSSIMAVAGVLLCVSLLRPPPGEVAPT